MRSFRAHGWWHIKGKRPMQMNPKRLIHIHRAAASATENLSRAMSGNVRLCPEMSGANTQIDKTNPMTAKDEGPPRRVNCGMKDQGRTVKASRPLAPRQLTAIHLLLSGQSAAGVSRRL